MISTINNETAPVAQPAYHRAQARLGLALHIDALTLVNTLHLLASCHGSTGDSHLHSYHHCRFGCPSGWTPQPHSLS